MNKDEITLDTELKSLSERTLFHEYQYTENGHKDTQAIYYQKFKRRRIYESLETYKKIFKSKDEVYLVETITNDQVVNSDWVGENTNMFFDFIENYHSFTLKISIVFAVFFSLFMSIAIEELSIYSLLSGLLGFFFIYPSLMLIYFFLQAILLIGQVIGLIGVSIYYHFMPEKLPENINCYVDHLNEKEFEHIIVWIIKQKLMEDPSILDVKYIQKYTLDSIQENEDNLDIHLQADFIITSLNGKHIRQKKQNVIMECSFPIESLNAYTTIENKIQSGKVQSMYIKKSRILSF